jgi:ATP-dependent Clp endopeptidase proteolytic subunit ClpP
MKYLVDIDPRIKLGKAEEALDVPVYVNFTGAFSEESAKKFRDELEAAEAHCAKSKQDVIPVVIDSYGGSVYALLSMIDTIQNCEVPIATIVEGKAMSCGAVLFTCGAEGKRYMGPNATVLIHDVSSFALGKEPDLRASAEEAKRLNTLIYELMAKNCGHKDKNYFYDLITEKRGADWFITPGECLKHNIANQIKIPQMKVSIQMDWEFG